MYAGRRGSKADVRFYQNSKKAILFQQDPHFIAFLFVRFWEEEGGLQQEYVCTFMKMIQKMDEP